MIDNNIPSAKFLTISHLIVTCLSLIGSFLMAYYCLRIRWKNVALKLIIALAISDFLFSASNLITMFGDPTGRTLCTVEAVLRSFFYVQTIFWASSTAILCYKVTKYNTSFNQGYFFKLSISLSILICGLITLA